MADSCRSTMAAICPPSLNLTAAQVHYPPTVRALQPWPRSAHHRAANSSARSVHTPKPCHAALAPRSHQHRRNAPSPGDVPRRWYLKHQLDEDSFAHELIFSGKTQPGFCKSSADTWFTNDDGKDYELREHSVEGYSGEVITFILPSDDMLDARYDPDAFPTRYNEMGQYMAKRNLKR